MRFAADLVLSLKVATPTLISGLALGVIDWAVKFESVLPKIASIVAIIGAIIIAVSHYCKMSWDNHHARAKARLDEIEIDLRRLEKEGEEKDNELKDEILKEQKLKNKILEKQFDNREGGP